MDSQTLQQQIQKIQSTLTSMARFMESFRNETKAAIEACVERSESAERSVGKLHGRITRMEKSIQGLWSKLDDYGTNFAEQAMDEIEAQHRRQGEQLKAIRLIMGHQTTINKIDQQDTPHYYKEQYWEETEPEREEKEEEEEEVEVGVEVEEGHVDRSPNDHLLDVWGSVDDVTEGVAQENENDYDEYDEYDDEMEEEEEHMQANRKKRKINEMGIGLVRSRRYYNRHQDYDCEGPLSILADEIAGLYGQLPSREVKSKVQSFVMEPRTLSLDELWDEWFAARGVRPSIWSMDRYALEWRTQVDSTFKQKYYFKKKIVYETLKTILAAEEEAVTEGWGLKERVKRGKRIIQEMVDRHGSVAKFHSTFRQRRGTTQNET
ncbi:hypothetical protein EC991_003765 [Linnemannia zychae]|nr:hypothetical protein EC991_003765 [Linnemannia zychae]